MSGDTEERAGRTLDERGLTSVPVAYGLTEAQMRTWDLYVSKGVKDPEPDLSSESALVLVQRTGPCTRRTCSPCRSPDPTWPTS